jgi:hypothetical protein
MKPFLSIVALLTTLVSTSAHAAEGRIPIFAPTTITASGNYILSRNVSATSGNVVTVQASNVSLDLNGFTLSGSGTANALVLIADGFSNIEVANGTLSGGAYAVLYTSPSAIATDVRLSHLYVDGSVSAGVSIGTAGKIEISNSTFKGGPAISLGGSPTNGRFTDNVIDSTPNPSPGAAVALSGGNGVIANNRINWHESVGISALGGGVITGNTITGPQIGLQLSGGTNIVTWNRVLGTDRSILVLSTSSGNSIVGNNLGIGSHGILCQGNWNEIRENTVIGSGGPFGISDFGTYNRIVGNSIVALDGASGIRAAGSHGFIENNSVTGASTGLNLEAGSSAMVFKNNILRGTTPLLNAGAGNTDGGGNTFLAP